VVDSEFVLKSEPDPERPSERDEELVRPLRLALGSLPDLSRLRLKGIYPLGSAVAQLPPLQARDHRCLVRSAELS